MKLGTRLEIGNRDWWIWKLLLTNFKTKMELPMWSAVFPSYPRLRSAIFIADLFQYNCRGELNYFRFTSSIFCRRKIFWIRKVGPKLVQPWYPQHLAVCFMRQEIKFTEGLTHDMVFASTLTWFHTHRGKHTQIRTDTHFYIINTTCYVHTAATWIKLDELLSDTKIYLKKFSLLYWMRAMSRAHASTLATSLVRVKKTLTAWNIVMKK